MPGKCTSLSVSLLFSLALACGSSGANTPAAPATSAVADLVLVGGELITVDPDRARASALAVRGNRIIYVGDDAGARALVGDSTRVVELAGAGVTPGLVDAHCHLAGLGSSLEALSLRGLASAEAVAAAVGQAAAERPAGEWITGRGWDQTLWPSRAFPHHRLLDQVAPEHPVAIRRVDGHALWANAAAMKRAGFDPARADVAGGQILRDETGAPTGVFVDNAMDLIEHAIPDPTPAIIERRIRAAAARATSLGLTGVHEMGIGDATIAVYRQLEATGELPLRVYGFLQGNREVVASLADRPAPETAAGPDEMFVLRAMKLYADGALGSRGAALLAPYADAPEQQGNWVHSAAEIHEMVAAATARGWQLGIHAIGDAGNRAVLDAYAAAQAGRPGADLRLRVEHAQLLAPEDIPRFARQNVIASMQPTHATSDMRWAQDRVGPERVKGAYAWRSLLDSGARIAAGSDFPVEEVSPLLGIYAAVTRQNPAGEPAGGWFADQRMSLDEAVAAFTAEAAYAGFAEGARGRLREGMQADITVYDRALKGDSTLLQTRVKMTIVGGRVVYEHR